MKTELIIFAIIAMVASSFLNADSVKQTEQNLADTKLRIEKISAVYAKSQQVQTVATRKAVEKPNEG